MSAIRFLCTGQCVAPRLVSLLYFSAIRGCTVRQSSTRHGSRDVASAREQRGSLASFHPALARTWLAAASSKMLQPHHVAPSSRKLAWWRCPTCEHQFNKRIDLHVAAGGSCPKCSTKPSLMAKRLGRSLKKTAPMLASQAEEEAGGVAAPGNAAIVHRCRPVSSQEALAAANGNRIKRSVADNAYLATRDTRNLLPMLAKSFEKERGKITPDELLYASPKLDGIRCIAAYDSEARRILFFSRAGTLFECCDARIDPALRYAFELDPQLVLDGELYNDSVNLRSFAAAARAPPPLASLFSMNLLAQDASAKGRVPLPARDVADALNFEQLTSAIRTTRDRRSPQVAALQEKLQYHIFDVLYASAFLSQPKRSSKVPGRYHSPCFTQRFHFLLRFLARVEQHNVRSIDGYDGRVLRLVPVIPCYKDEVDEVLRAAMQLGYEGVMLRRDSLRGAHLTLPPDREDGDRGDVRRPAKTKGARAAPPHHSLAAPLTLQTVQNRLQQVANACEQQQQQHRSGESDTSGGYAYGQRSCTLLKYKIMQDDEFIIVSAVEGKGKWRGCLGAFVCETRNQQKTFTVTPASTDTQKKAMWHHWKKHYKGKALTVQYQVLTPDGVPRFPVGKGIRGAASGMDWI